MRALEVGRVNNDFAVHFEENLISWLLKYGISVLREIKNPGGSPSARVFPY
jgi:hypothetical protein